MIVGGEALQVALERARRLIEESPDKWPPVTPGERRGWPYSLVEKQEPPK